MLPELCRFNKILFGLIVLILCSCSDQQEQKHEEISPTHNDSDVLEKQVLLGRYLFYDKALSIDSSVSCASCHQQQYGFADNKPISPGHHQKKGIRNAITLVNLEAHPYLLWDGAASGLEKQVLIPLNDSLEMNLDVMDVAERLADNSFYQNLSQEAYQRPLDPFVITRAITAFELTLQSKNSKYDRYLAGEKDILNEEELKGMTLFFGDRLKCSECHSGPDFTDYSFQNNGAVTNYELDSGRIRLTFNEADRNLYKVPSLRNCEVSAPYMHNGSIATLSEVIDLYANGGHSIPQKSNKIAGFELYLEEKTALISFLRTLTDTEFLTKEELDDPFEE